MNASSSMKASSWLRAAEETLKDVDIATARLDCLVLLEDETGKDRGWLLAHPEYDLQRSEIKKLNTKITQRSQHIPLAYIRGKVEFYGREFAVNAHTLVPRPETERMIDLLKNIKSAQHARILDIGTGSGCIAITAALELPHAHVTACDIDTTCLHTAEQNAQHLHVPVTFFESNLLENAEACDIIVANLPYVPDNFQINRAATHEPRHALFGGTDGLDLYRELFAQIQQLVSKPVAILTESLPPQQETLVGIAKAAGYALQRTDDFIQLFEQIS